MPTKAAGPQIDQYLLRTERMIFSACAGTGPRWPRSAACCCCTGSARCSCSGCSAQVEILRLVALCFMFFSLCWFAWQILDWRIERFMVTNRRVLLISGILTRNVAIMPLMKVTDLTYQQSPLGRILNYGSFILESAGQQQALSRVDFLPQPAKRYQQVSGLLFGTERRHRSRRQPAGQQPGRVRHRARPDRASVRPATARSA